MLGMERKAGLFQRVDLSGLESTIELHCTFYGDPKTLCLHTIGYQCVAILLPGARLNTFMSRYVHATRYHCPLRLI